MRTPEEIEAQLRKDNPTSEVGGKVHKAGDAVYEAQMTEWVAEMQKQEAVADGQAEAAAKSEAAMATVPELEAGKGTMDERIARLEKLCCVLCQKR